MSQAILFLSNPQRAHHSQGLSFAILGFQTIQAFSRSNGTFARNSALNVVKDYLVVMGHTEPSNHIIMFPSGQDPTVIPNTAGSPIPRQSLGPNFNQLHLQDCIIGHWQVQRSRHEDLSVHTAVGPNL